MRAPARRSGRRPGRRRSSSADQSTEAGIAAQRARVAALKEQLAGDRRRPRRSDLLSLADALVKKSVWIVGGDGWAYDIGYGGLDHVLASGRNVNMLVLDTEVYSNTGGQMSKATPARRRGQVRRRRQAAAPRRTWAMMAMTYGNVYVAQVAMGANDAQTRQGLPARPRPTTGPSLIIAYSHCIAHGIDMAKGLDQQKLAVQSGHWPLLPLQPGAGRRRARTRCSSTRKAPSLPLERLHVQRDPLHAC